MIDRHLLGDVALAILFALPAAALARPQPLPTEQAASKPVQARVAVASTDRASRSPLG